eukprot:1818575-Prymnesium_polylepis.1
MALAAALPGFHSEYDTQAPAPPSFFIFAVVLIAAGLLCVLLWLRGSPKPVRKAPKSQLLDELWRLPAQVAAAECVVYLPRRGFWTVSRCDACGSAGCGC